MNWCVSTRAHHYLMLHAAVIERDGVGGCCLRHPGQARARCARPWCIGAATAVRRGALVSLRDGRISPAARRSASRTPLSIIRAFAPGCRFSPTTHGTTRARSHISELHANMWCAHAGTCPATLGGRAALHGPARLLAPCGWLNPDDPGHQCAFNYTPCSAGSGFEALGRLVEGCEVLSSATAS